MRTYDEYIFTPKIIKSILLKEHATWFHFQNVGMHDYLAYALSLVTDKINSLQTYDDIESFILDSRRMTLSDWIETL